MHQVIFVVDLLVYIEQACTSSFLKVTLGTRYLAWRNCLACGEHVFYSQICMANWPQEWSFLPQSQMGLRYNGLSCTRMNIAIRIQISWAPLEKQNHSSSSFARKKKKSLGTVMILWKLKASKISTDGEKETDPKMNIRKDIKPLSTSLGHKAILPSPCFQIKKPYFVWVCS